MRIYEDEHCIYGSVLRGRGRGQEMTKSQWTLQKTTKKLFLLLASSAAEHSSPLI